MKEIALRVKKFLDERDKMRGIDPEAISNIQTGTDKEAVLSASDLRALLSALNDRDEALRAMLRDVVPHVRDVGHNAADREMSHAIRTAQSLVE